MKIPRRTKAGYFHTSVPSCPVGWVTSIPTVGIPIRPAEGSTDDGKVCQGQDDGAADQSARS